MAADRTPRLVALAAALALGCDDGSDDTRPPPVTAPSDIGPVDAPINSPDAPSTPDASDGGEPGMPAGLVVEGASLYRFDTTRADVSLTVAGSSAHRIVGRLRDAVGRRELLFDDVSFAPAGWHLPPVAAVAPDGSTLVCFNTLTGGPSPLSSPEAPDPSQGMRLACRLRAASGAWSPRAEVPQRTRGAWLQRVEALTDGSFRVTFYGDDGYLVGPAREGHGVYVSVYTAGALSPPTLLTPATELAGSGLTI